MQTFVKLNIFSALYALALLIEIESMMYIDRISKNANWSGNITDLVVVIFDLFIFIISTILFFVLTKKYLNTGKLRYLVTVLWIPYLAIFIYIFSYLFPTTNLGDDDHYYFLQATMIIIYFLIYPFYIATINMISSKTKDS